MSIYPPTGTLEIKNATLKIPVVDLQYTSNTAKLEANSNVVTEFSRSKKLIKYPRVLLTSAALNSAYENGYRVTFSSENTSYRAYHPFSRDENSAVGWHSNNGTTGAPYDGTGGLYGTSGTARLAAETERGEWLGLELPVAIKLERLRMVSQSYSTVVNTIDDFIVYAKKQSGDTWTNIGTFTGIAQLQTSADGAMFDVNAVEYYKFFAIVATKRYAAGADSGVSIRVLEYFGVPEYDPDADGTDVTLKSLANVPNTDWLEIYYDAKDLADGAVSTAAGAITALGGTSNGGTAVGDPQVSKGAFVFDGNGDYIYNSQSGYTSRVVYTGCAWIKKASKTNGCIFQFGNGSNNSGIGLFSFGSPSETKTMRAFVYGGADADYKEDVPLNEWFHVVAVISDKKATLYLNGVVVATDTGSTTITIPSTPYLSLGVQTNSSNTPFSSTYFDGSIANFRLFNRNLTTDEIYQLYAYQKEYFGYSTNNLTLKAGRLGIGTSEPRAALDVRGDIYGGCPVFFRARKTTDTIGGADPIIWDETMVNKGGGYDTSTGKFTAPVSGYYEFIYGGVSGREDWSAEIFAKKNDVKIDGSGAYTSGGDGHSARALINTVILELNQGDVFHLYLVSGNQDFYGTSTYSYNFFSGKYLSN